MRSYNGLYVAMLQPDAMQQAILDAAIGKHGRRCVQRALADLSNTALRVIEKVKDGTWFDPDNVHYEKINEGSYRKVRMIYRPQWNCEQIVHHALVAQFRKVVEPRLYPHVYGAVGKTEIFGPPWKPWARPHGPKQAMKVLHKWVKGYKGKRFYVAELDIRQFYASVDHGILMERLSRIIRDKAFLQLIETAISPFEGLPLGNVLSPWLSTFYLMEMDNYILQDLRPDHYLRYVDNLWLMSRNKRHLHRAVSKLTKWLWENRGLTFNSSRQVYRFGPRGINALGWVIHRDRVTVRKSVLCRARRKAMRMGRKSRITWFDAVQMVSRMGMLWTADVYMYTKRWIEPHVSVGECKVLISRHQRRVHNECQDRQRKH